MASKTYAELQEAAICRNLIASCEAEILSVTYHVMPSNRVICQLHLKNGFVLDGVADPTSSRQRDMQTARRKAISKFLTIKRYCQMEQLHRNSLD